MQPVFSHPWEISFKEAAELQRKLRQRLVYEEYTGQINLIAGADISYARKTNTNYAGALVFSYPGLELVEEVGVARECHFPYVPGFLSFREGPPLLEVLSRLRHEPDILVFDGQGIAHPRRLGIAAHLGVILDKPAIGCAKTRLCGKYDPPPDEVGAWSPLTHQGETVGAVLRTKKGTKPVFISTGHRITLNQALQVVSACCRGYRLPEVVRRAHLFVNRLRIEKDPILK